MVFPKWKWVQLKMVMTLVVIIMILHTDRLESQTPIDDLQFAFTKSEPTEEMLAHWVDQLSDPHYSTRELAAYRLLRSGNASLPIIETTISKADAETSERLIRILCELGSDPISDSGSEAIAVLRRIASRVITSEAILASNALNSIGEQQRGISEQALNQLGALSGKGNVQVLTDLRLDRYRMRIDETFRGKGDDLRRLEWMQGLDHLQLDGPQVSRLWLERVRNMPSLRILQIRRATLEPEDLSLLEDLTQLETLEILYTPIDDRAIARIERIPVKNSMRIFGTKITKEGIGKLRESLADLEILFGRGGYLGVKTIEDRQSPVIDVVSGGAAEKAGLRRGDRLIAIDQYPIRSFEELRSRLGEYAANDKVEVKFLRQDYETMRIVEGVANVVLGEQEFSTER